MRKLVFATRNHGKLREMRQIVDLPDVELMCLDDLSGIPEIEETGLTFSENATLKARAAMEWSGLPAFADDSGLEVDALGGDPGVYSARYGGCRLSGIDLLLKNLAGVPLCERTARFRCVVAFMEPLDIRPKLFQGTCEGLIINAPRGSNGFGFDPVFYTDELGCTLAEASAEDKNRISHRGKALREMVDFLRNSA